MIKKTMQQLPSLLQEYSTGCKTERLNLFLLEAFFVWRFDAPFTHNEWKHHPSSNGFQRGSPKSLDDKIRFLLPIDNPLGEQS